MADNTEKQTGTNTTARYQVGENLTHQLEKLPVLGKTLNDFNVKYCDVTSDNFGLGKDMCQAFRETVQRERSPSR